MVEVVEQVLGRAVRSFMSANDLHRNLQVEVFVLAAGAANGADGAGPAPR
jgi:uncharacterized protein YbcI